MIPFNIEGLWSLNSWVFWGHNKTDLSQDVGSDDLQRFFQCIGKVHSSVLQNFYNTLILIPLSFFLMHWGFILFIHYKAWIK